MPDGAWLEASPPQKLLRDDQPWPPPDAEPRAHPALGCGADAIPGRSVAQFSPGISA